MHCTANTHHKWNLSMYVFIRLSLNYNYVSTTIVVLCTDLPFGSNISPLVVEVTPETNDRLHVKIYDPNNQRWEVPTRLVS